ncbi:MAG: hypothetical protein P8L18_04130 [Verrucomicrobiota bacterium]|nr:hypothetical protein [Verrucomicrobiota bacterium]
MIPDMTFLAYVNMLPLIFVFGLVILLGLVLMLRRSMGIKSGKLKLLGVTSLIYTALFTFFLTEAGPFMGRTELQTFKMRWKIKQQNSQQTPTAEVLFSFIDFPGNHIGEYSDALAEHLRTGQKTEIDAVFEVTHDYGRMRGHSMVEVDGLREWPSEWGYARTTGSPETSPWD